MPATSYIKMIDIWMLFTMTVPFLEVVFHTTNEVFKQHDSASEKQIDLVRVMPHGSIEEEKEEGEMVKTNSLKSTLIRLTSCYILPLSSLIFTFIFWIVGLLQTYSLDTTQDPNMSDCLVVDRN